MGNCIEELNRIEKMLLSNDFNYEAELVEAIKCNPSQLDAYDLAFSISFGVLGAIITTNEAIEKYLDSIHELASGNRTPESEFEKVLSKLLYHKGDWVDHGEKYYENIINKPKYSTDFIARDGGNIHGPHRIFWGHDIFSFGEDNPFYLSIKQHGILKGIFRAFSHLIADTCSKQGLPLPGHSWFDYKMENGVGNYLLDFCKQYSKEVLGNAGGGVDSTVFNHFFSIRLQDVMSQGLTTVLSSVYLKIRGISDDIRCCQFRIISSFVNFYGGCILGTIKSGGIPYINWPAAGTLMKNNIQLLYLSNKETRDLLISTLLILDESKTIFEHERLLQKQVVNDLFKSLDQSKNKSDYALIDFLGGN